MDTLFAFGVYLDGDQLYVSCETGKTKFSGTLFTHVAKENGYKFNQWVHYGDNRHSDIRVPQKLGISTIHIANDYLGYEKVWAQNSYSGGLDVSHLLSGISRAIRLSNSRDIQTDFSVDIVAPLYVPFVATILQDAEKRGIQRLYFLARDSYVLYLVARKLQSLYPNIDLKYLYVSRKSLYLPGCNSFDSKYLINLLAPIHGRSVREIFDRLGVDLSEFGLKGFYDSIITPDNYPDFVNFLRREDVKASIEYSASTCRMEANEYFRASGLYDGLKNAIVDLRGTRSCHASINQILRANGGDDVFAYYLEVMESRRTLLDAGKFRAEMYRERLPNNDNLRGYFSHFDLHEQFFSLTDQSRTIGYEKNDKGLSVPVFEAALDMTASELHRKSIARNRCENIALFAEYFVDLNLVNFSEQLLHSIGVPTVAKFGNKPKLEYLEAICGLRVSDTKHRTIPYLMKMNGINIIRLFVSPFRIKKDCVWFEGSIYLSLGGRGGGVYIGMWNVIARLVKRIKKMLRK
jgi:predicted HAD superfamily hydrolase